MQNSSYSPTQSENCTVPSGQSVAIIMPFRDNDSKGNSRRGSKWIFISFSVRTRQLYLFLHYTIPILIRQNIKFKIFVVSQIDGNLFNRAKLLNIGFNEGKQFYRKLDFNPIHLNSTLNDHPFFRGYKF